MQKRKKELNYVGRKNRYETHVKPRLDEVKEWIQLLTEDQIAKRLGISPRSFATYKKEHEELQDALKKGIDTLVEDLKLTMKKKAVGFRYTEKKKTIRKTGDGEVVVLEEFERYSPPDLGAMHLLLKNYDPTWKNDDATTIEMKKQKLKLEQERAESNQWG